MGTDALDGGEPANIGVKLQQPWKGSRPPRRHPSKAFLVMAAAVRLHRRMTPNWRYVEASNTWFFWNGVCWQRERVASGLWQQAQDAAPIWHKEILERNPDFDLARLVREDSMPPLPPPSRFGMQIPGS
jgi:hypothetical protein